MSISLSIAMILHTAHADTKDSTLPVAASNFDQARMVGQIESEHLVECSGIDTSTVDSDLYWAVNDGGHGPFLYALGGNGRDRGRVRIAGARNRDWEGLESFIWQGRPMMLIADFGDNDRRRDRYTLYLVEEPCVSGERLPSSSVAKVFGRIDFSYPDGKHDAEGVAVDVAANEILVLTKRDDPPLLFALPLAMTASDQPAAARRVASVDQIPPPSDEDRLHPYGAYRSQPTALDLSADGLQMVVLTYKHAYLYRRSPGDSWASIVGMRPAQIQLPLPQSTYLLRQREAICFSRDNLSLLVSSEGSRAGWFILTVK
jgi:hypothetical protein